MRIECSSDKEKTLAKGKKDKEKNYLSEQILWSDWLCELFFMVIVTNLSSLGFPYRNIHLVTST